MNEIKVTLGGKERTLKFGLFAIHIYTQRLNAETIESSEIYATFYAGLKFEYYAAQQPEDFTFGDVVNWVDELIETNNSEVARVCNFFSETTAYKRWLEEVKQHLSQSVEEITNTPLTPEKPVKKRAVKKKQPLAVA